MTFQAVTYLGGNSEFQCLSLVLPEFEFEVEVDERYYYLCRWIVLIAAIYE